MLAATVLCRQATLSGDAAFVVLGSSPCRRCVMMKPYKDPMVFPHPHYSSYSASVSVFFILLFLVVSLFLVSARHTHSFLCCPSLPLLQSFLSLSQYRLVSISLYIASSNCLDLHYITLHCLVD
ncbi:hypothetical protein BJX64DRAFT_22975 [Aspergillus heterothallicus]